MIKVRRIGSGGTVLAINGELIQTVEATPDTVISLTTGDRYVVQESLDEVIALVIGYRGRVLATARNLAPAPHAGEEE